MQDDQIDAGLTEIFHDLFADGTIVLSPQTTAADVKDWDSIKHISLIVAIEERFGVKFRTAEIDGLKNVGDMHRMIAAKLAQAGR